MSEMISNLIMIKRLAVGKRCINDHAFADKYGLCYRKVMYELSDIDIENLYDDLEPNIDAKAAMLKPLTKYKDLLGGKVEICELKRNKSAKAYDRVNKRLPKVFDDYSGYEHTFSDLRSEQTRICVRTPVFMTKVLPDTSGWKQLYEHNLKDFGVRSGEKLEFADLIVHALLWHHFASCFRSVFPDTSKECIEVRDIKAWRELSLHSFKADGGHRNVTYISGPMYSRRRVHTRQEEHDFAFCMSSDLRWKDRPEVAVFPVCTELELPMNSHVKSCIPEVLFVLAKDCFGFTDFEDTVYATKEGSSIEKPCTICRESYSRYSYSNNAHTLYCPTWMAAPLRIEELKEISENENVFGNHTDEFRRFMSALPDRAEFEVFNDPVIFERYRGGCWDIGKNIYEIFSGGKREYGIRENEESLCLMIRYMMLLRSCRVSADLFNYMVHEYFDSSTMYILERYVWGIETENNARNKWVVDFCNSDLGKSYLKQAKQVGLYCMNIETGVHTCAGKTAFDEFTSRSWTGKVDKFLTYLNWEFETDNDGYLRIRVKGVKGATPKGKQEYYVSGISFLTVLNKWKSAFLIGYDKVFVFDYAAVFKNIRIICTESEQAEFEKYSDYLAKRCIVIDPENLEISNAFEGNVTLNDAFGLSLVEKEVPEKFPGCHRAAFVLGLHEIIQNNGGALPSFSGLGDFRRVFGDQITEKDLKALKVFAVFETTATSMLAGVKLIWTSAGFIVHNGYALSGDDNATYTCIALSELYGFLGTFAGFDKTAESFLNVADVVSSNKYIFATCKLGCEHWRTDILGYLGMTFDKYRQKDFLEKLFKRQYVGAVYVRGNLSVSGGYWRDHGAAAFVRYLTSTKKYFPDRLEFSTFYDSKITDVVNLLYSIEYLAGSDGVNVFINANDLPITEFMQ